MRPASVLVFTVAAVCSISLRAAQHSPPTFDELVDEAGAIVQTEVLDTTSRWDSLQGRRVIVTEVRLRVERLIKGRADGVITLRMLGGFVGDVNQHVAGTPRFLVGDRDVLFLSRQRGLISPLIGQSHGRFRVVSGHDGSGRYVANFALQPLRSVAEYQSPQRLSAGERALTLDYFIAAITARLPQ